MSRRLVRVASQNTRFRLINLHGTVMQVSFTALQPWCDTEASRLSWASIGRKEASVGQRSALSFGYNARASCGRGAAKRWQTDVHTTCSRRLPKGESLILSQSSTGQTPNEDRSRVPAEGITAIGRKPTILTEVALRPTPHQAAMRTDLARYAMILTAGIVLFGALGTVAGNQGMVSYAESALGALWKILGVVYLSCFAGTDPASVALWRLLSQRR